jgi:uncharacterized protein (TIGR03792 family)
VWQLIIEYLNFDVPLAAQPAFIAQDAAIWTPALARSPGFLGKEVWRQADELTRITLVIRWRARADWDAVDRGLLARTQAAFVAALGTDYPVLSCTAFEVMPPA